MKMKNVGWVLALTAVLLFIGMTPAQTAFAADGDWSSVVQQIGAKGKVDWSTGVIEATGTGAPPEKYYGKPQARPMALRAAQLDAYRNLLEVVEGVQINSRTTIKDYSTESDEIRSQVSGMVKGAVVVKREYLSDGTVEVTVRMPMQGGFSQLILPQTIRQIEPVTQVDKPQAGNTPDTPAVTPETMAPPAAGQPVTPVATSDVFTGLVVDARTIQARPAMAPKIVDEDGKEVYGSGFVSREYAVQQGMSGYAKDLTAAQANARVTNSPLTVKGLRTDGPGKCDIVISRADAAKIRGASDNLSFLKKCRVMIVLD